MSENTQPHSESPSHIRHEWVTYVPEQYYGLVIDAPGIGSIAASLSVGSGEDARESRSLYIDMFTADQPGQGQGKQLIQLLTEEGRKFGATSLSGHFTSAEALGAFATVMGHDNVKFYERYSVQLVEINIEEAMQHPDNYISMSAIE